MAKRRVPLGGKTIAQKIEGGENIVGTKGYVRCEWKHDTEIFIPVRVDGLKVAAKGSCGITIQVTPVGGFDPFETTPCDFYYSKTEVTAFRQSQEKIRDAENAYRTIGKWPTARSRKDALKSFVAEHKRNDLYDQEVVTPKGKDETDHCLQTVSQVIIADVFRLTPDEMDQCSFRGWRNGSGW